MSVLQSGKMLLAEATNLSREALHVHLGLAVMLLVVIGFNKPLSDWRPLLAVAFASVAGEIWDVVDTFSHGGTPVWNPSWTSVANTLFWPAVLFGLARFTGYLKR